MSTDANLEDRVAALEAAVSKLLLQNANGNNSVGDWRSTLGMFPNNETLKQIDEEGRRIREADRRKAQQ